jgi:hypothetical protein
MSDIDKAKAALERIADNGRRAGAVIRKYLEFNEKIVGAAAEMKLTSMHPASAAFIEVATKLPAGRLYASGKAFIAPIRRDLLGKLSPVLEASGDTSQVHKPTMADPDKAAQNSVPQGKLPRCWDSIDVGHIVLVDDSSEFGWCPCLVLKREDQV